MFERFSASAREIVVRARDEAIQSRHRQIGAEHLLLAMFDDRAGTAYTALRETGVDRERVRAAIAGHAVPARLLSDEDATALRAIGIDLDKVLASIERSFGAQALVPPPPPAAQGRSGTRLRFSPGARKLLGQALREVRSLGHGSLESGHLLLAMLPREAASNHTGPGPDDRAAQVLLDADVSLAALRAATLSSLDTATRTSR